MNVEIWVTVEMIRKRHLDDVVAFHTEQMLERHNVFESIGGVKNSSLVNVMEEGKAGTSTWLEIRYTKN